MQLLQRFWPSLLVSSELPSQTFFYEVVPSAQLDGSTPALLPYERREALTLEVLRELVPAVLEATGVDPATTQHRSGPGGYKREVNPSLHSHVTIDDGRANVVAAALGWVFRQWSVLVADLRDRAQGRTGYAIVDLGDGPLLADRAEAFFLYGASCHSGLGEGFTAFDDDMLYLNVRDASGAPYSGLGDEEFAAGLRQTAETFSSFAQVGEIGIADARFVENDWTQAPDGEQYAAILESVNMQRLQELRHRHTALVRAAVASDAT